MPEDTKTLLEQLREQRDTLRTDDTAAIEAREADRMAFEARTDRTDDDVRAFAEAEVAHQAARDERKAEIKALSKRIAEQKDVEARRAAAARAALAAGSIPAGEYVTSEPLTYREDNARSASYFADLACAMNPHVESHMTTRTTKRAAQERLEHHASEMRVEMPKLEARRAAEARAKMERSVEPQLRAALGDPFRRSPFGVEQRVTPGRTEGQGGYFVPPMWMDAFIKGLRPGRVTSNLCTQFDMPSGTDRIVVPKLSTLTTVDVQTGDSTPVSNTDWTDTAVTGQVKTLAGFSDVSIQLLDQSPYPLDQMILADLLADYDKKTDLQVIQGNASTTTSYTPTPGGQVPGLYSSAGASPWGGYNGVTYTDGSPAAYKMFSVAGAMGSKIMTNRFDVSSLAFVVHPRRAMWWAAGLDSNNRPLVESRNFGPFNVDAVESDSIPAEGLVMQLPWGPRLYQSANVPTADTAGGGTGQDVAIGVNFSDAWFFEGQMHTDVFPEILSSTLGVRFRVFSYVAFLVRYGQSIAIASGSGFAAPTGAVSSITF